MKEFNANINKGQLNAEIVSNSTSTAIILETNSTYTKILPDKVIELPQNVEYKDVIFALSKDRVQVDTETFIPAAVQSGYDIIESVETVYDGYRTNFGLLISDLHLILNKSISKVDIECYAEQESQLNDTIIIPAGYHTISIQTSGNSLSLGLNSPIYIKSLRFYLTQTEHTYQYSFSYPIIKDAVYNIYGIEFPDKSVDVTRYSYIYYLEDNVIKKYITSTSQILPNDEVTEDTILKEITLLESIPEGEKQSLTLVSIENMIKCYINYCKEIFKTRTSSNCFSANTISSELIYKRDLVWMAINIIKYLIEGKLYLEIQRIISLLEGCNGLCNNNINSKYNGCGCSK